MNAHMIQASERYARALFEIARMVHKDEEIEDELESFSAALKKDPKIGRFMANPRLTVSDKRALLEKIYHERHHEIYEQLLNFFTVLLEKGRFELIHDIAVEFKRIADEAHGLAVAEIRSAHPIDAARQARIVERLERLAGYKIEVQSEVDPTLVGGVLVKIKNKVLDGSIKHKLDNMKKELTGRQECR